MSFASTVTYYSTCSMKKVLKIEKKKYSDILFFVDKVDVNQERLVFFKTKENNCF